MLSTLHIKPLIFADRLLQAVQTSPSEFLTLTQTGVQTWQVREGEMVQLSETQLDRSLLLVLTHQAQDHTTTALAGASHPATGFWGCRMVWINQAGLQDRDVALNTPQSQHNERTHSREPQPFHSNAICPPAYPDISIGAVSAYKGCVHVYGTSSDLNASKQALTQTIYDFTAAAAAADPYEEGKECLRSYYHNM